MRLKVAFLRNNKAEEGTKKGYGFLPAATPERMMH